MTSRHATFSATLAFLLLAGCSSADKSESAAMAKTQAGQGCDASAVQGLVGQTASPALLEQARQRAGARSARAIGPHDGITLDYDSGRLNLDIDERLVVKQVYCG